MADHSFQSLIMVKSNMLIYLKNEQKYLPQVSCSNFFPDPIFAVIFGIRGKVELSSNLHYIVFNQQLLWNGGFQNSC